MAVINEYQKAVNLALNVLAKAGINPIELHPFLLFVNLDLLLSTTLFTIYGFFFGELTIIEISAYTTTIAIFGQMILKNFAIIIKRQEIRLFMMNVTNYWPIDSQEISSDKFKNTCKTTLTVSLKMMRFFLTYCYGIAVFIVILQIYGIEIVCFDTHRPKFVPFWLFALFSDLSFIFIVNILVGCDLLFSTMAVTLGIQFKLFNKSFKTIINGFIEKQFNEERFVNLLKSRLDHHNFLLTQFQLLNQIFSGMLLAHLLNNVVLVCFLLYTIIENTTGLASTIKYSMFLVGPFFQLFLFCSLPSEYLSNEINKTILSLYKSKWYELENVSFRRMLIIIMSRMQMDMIVSAEGLKNINLATCTEIFKTAFTFYTALQNIKKL